MAGMGAGYDLSVATFSPDGRVFQVEYASKAVDSSCTALAFVCKDGVIAALERPSVTKMLVPGSSPRIHAVDKHCSISVCGFAADGRQIVLRARAEASQYKHAYGEPIPGHVLAERIALFVHVYTLAWSIRPLGASVLLSVLESKDALPELYCIDPAGTCFKYFGMALGKARQSAKTEIEKLDRSKLTCREAIFHAARILHQIQDDSKKDMSLEMAWHCPDSDFVFQRIPDAYIKDAETKALQHLEQLELED